MAELLSEVVQKFIFLSENLTPTQLWWVIAIAFLLFIFLVYRIVGLGAVLGILLIAFFVYILYDHNSFKKYEERNKNEAAYMKLIDEELQKDDSQAD